jgi:hypothetical protein
VFFSATVADLVQRNVAPDPPIGSASTLLQARAIRPAGDLAIRSTDRLGRVLTALGAQHPRQAARRTRP